VILLKHAISLSKFSIRISLITETPRQWKRGAAAPVKVYHQTHRDEADKSRLVTLCYARGLHGITAPLTPLWEFSVDNAHLKIGVPTEGSRSCETANTPVMSGSITTSSSTGESGSPWHIPESSGSCFRGPSARRSLASANPFVSCCTCYVSLSVRFSEIS